MYANQSDRFDRSTAERYEKDILFRCTYKTKWYSYEARGREREKINDCSINYYWFLYVSQNGKCHSTRIAFNLFVSRKFTTCTIVNNDNNIYCLNRTNLFNSLNETMRQTNSIQNSMCTLSHAHSFIQNGADSINSIPFHGKCLSVFLCMFLLSCLTEPFTEDSTGGIVKQTMAASCVAFQLRLA